MSDINNHITVSIALETATAPQTSYRQMLLVDHEDVPIYERYRDVSPDELTDLTADGVPREWATAFWSQGLDADYLRLGRWIKTASSPHFICGSHVETLSTWTAVTNGALRIRDNTGTPLVDTLSSLNFSSCTSFADVLDVLNTALAALSPHNILGIESGEFALDALGRVVLTNSTTGASAKTIEIYAPASGTDITTSAFLDVADGHIVPGYDAEEPTDALDAISAKVGGDEWYDVAVRGESAAQQLALSTYINALPRQLTLVSGDANCKSAVATSDIAYLAKALGHNRTTVIYTEHDTDTTVGCPDAALNGACYPYQEGSIAWGWTDVSGVYQSGADGTGAPVMLTSAERLALQGKNCLYLETVGTATFSHSGLNVGGVEKRIILGADWVVNSITADVFNYNITADLPAFDNKTLTALEGIVRRYLTEARARGIIVDTEDRPIVIDFPSEDDFTSAQRASHEMDLSDCFSAYLNSAVQEVTLTGRFVE